MRVQAQNGNPRRINSKVHFQRAVKSHDLFGQQFFGQRLRNLTHRNIFRGQRHAEIPLHQNGQSFPSAADPFLKKSAMARKAGRIGLHGLFVCRRGNQHVEQAFLVFLHRFLKSGNGSLARFGRRFRKFNLQLLIDAVHHIHPSVLHIRSRIDDAEVCRNVHRLPVIGSHLGRAVNNRRTKLQHRRIRECLENHFIADSVDISVGNTHFNSFTFHI